MTEETVTTTSGERKSGKYGHCHLMVKDKEKYVVNSTIHDSYLVCSWFSVFNYIQKNIIVGVQQIPTTSDIGQAWLINTLKDHLYFFMNNII